MIDISDNEALSEGNNSDEPMKSAKKGGIAKELLGHEVLSLQ